MTSEGREYTCEACGKRMWVTVPTVRCACGHVEQHPGNPAALLEALRGLRLDRRAESARKRWVARKAK